MNTITLTIVLTIIGILVLYCFYHFTKKKQLNKMVSALKNTDFDSFFETANAKITRYVFPKFNLEYLKLNALILKQDTKAIEKAFNEMFKLKMTPPQKEDIYMKAFNYYVGLENKRKTKELITTIETFDNEEMKKEARTIYDIFILKKANYIEEMEQELANDDLASKGINEYLLSVQYRNIKDEKKAKHYEKLSKKHLNEIKE
ncbi:MAG: hypothetical protein ACK5G7_02590 [Erysipelotrichaceae bacterium]